LEDAAGHHYVDGTQSSPLIAATANAPTYPMDDAAMGRGVVGGHLDILAVRGREVGELVLRILNGERPQNIPIVRASNFYIFDWRALQRWGIKESDLPPGSIVLNRQPTFWELYKRYVLGGILLVSVETLLILGLLLERVKRRKVEASLVTSNTELKRSEAVLRESEERLRVAAEVGRMYAWEWDPATDSVRRSAEWASIVGLSDGPVPTTAEDYFSFIHADDRAKRSLVDSLTPEDRVYRTQYRRFRADGALLWLEEAGRATFDGDGKMVRLVGMTADITEQKGTKEALRESELLKGSILESLPSSVAVIDRDGLILEMNENWLAFTNGNGSTSPQLAVEVGVNYLDHFLNASAENEEAMESYSGLLSVLNRSVRQFEIEYPCHSPADQRWFRMSATGLNGPRGGALIRHIDITGQKLAEIDLRRTQEEMARMNRAAEIGQLGASLAHELAQPLSGILSNAQAAARVASRPDPDLAEVQAALGDIIESDRRASAVLGKVRAILKKHTVVPHEVNLNEIVEDVMTMVRANTRQRGVQLRPVLHPDGCWYGETRFHSSRYC
jgi:PAS domain S-box-containing protein